jgi:hypothetical protein
VRSRQAANLAGWRCRLRGGNLIQTADEPGRPIALDLAATVPTDTTMARATRVASTPGETSDLLTVLGRLLG